MVRLTKNLTSIDRSQLMVRYNLRRINTEDEVVNSFLIWEIKNFTRDVRLCKIFFDFVILAGHYYSTEITVSI